MQALYDHALKLGVRIEYADLTHLGRPGDYDLLTRTIRLQPGQLYRKERSTLAHELGHATHGDEHSMFEHTNRRMEDRADEWAANFLIELTEYRIAEEKLGHNTEALAQELAVTRKLIRAYRRTLAKGSLVEPCPLSPWAYAEAI